MENVESFIARQPERKSIKEQTQHDELESVVLFERIHNPVIRNQIIDLLDRGEKAKDGEEYTFFFTDEKGRNRRSKEGSIMKETRKYVAKTREQIEADFDRAVDQAQAMTSISLKENRPNIEPTKTRIPINWIDPKTGEKPSLKMWAIIEAHEKGHVIRPYRGEYFDELFGAAFDKRAVKYTRDDYFRDFSKKQRTKLGFEDAKQGLYPYLFSAPELAERMSQLKNYFGMRGNEQFTKEHLDYARANYVKDKVLDNRMWLFFRAITPEKEEAFLNLINSAGI